MSVKNISPVRQRKMNTAHLKRNSKLISTCNKFTDRRLRVQNISQNILIIDEKSRRHPYFENEKSREQLEDFDWLRSI